MNATPAESWMNNTYSNETLAFMNTTEDNDKLSSCAEYQQFRCVIYTFVVPSLCLIGSVGSVVGVAFLFRGLRKEATFYNIYLFSLFIFDSMTLLYGFWTAIPAIVSNFDQKLGLYLEVNRLKYHRYLLLCFSNNSAFVVLVISLQRFLALTKPHSAKDSWLTKYPVKFVLTTVTFNLVFLAPTLLIPGSFPDAKTYSTVKVVNKDSFLPEMVQNLYQLTQVFIYIYLELILALFLNVSIIVMIKKSARKHVCDGLPSAIERRQHQMTYTTLIILSLFVLLKIPGVIVTAIKKMFVFTDIFTVLTYLNCSLDMPVYVMFHPRLRKELLQRFCCFRKDETQAIVNE